MILKFGQNAVSNVEKAIYSHNHAIENLNLKCEEVVEDLLGYNANILDVRCVGSNPLNKESENSTLYTHTFLENNPANGTYAATNPATGPYSAGGFNGLLKGTDTNYETDYNQIRYSMKPNNNKEYWFASRHSEYDSYDNWVLFATEVCKINNNKQYHGLEPNLYVETNKLIINEGDDPAAYGVRPVIILRSGTLENASGSGTEVDPFIIQ